MNSCERSPPDRPGIGFHRNRAQPHARKGAQVGDEHALVGLARALLVEIERVGVLHQELAPTHDAEAGTDLVTELPLNVVEVLRQVLVALQAIADDHRDHLLRRRTKQHVALVAILDAQHLLAVGLVASALSPELRRLDGRHQKLDRAGPVLLLADNSLDLLEHPEPERQPGVDPGGGLADHACAQHELVGDDLRLFRRFTRTGRK